MAYSLSSYYFRNVFNWNTFRRSSNIPNFVSFLTEGQLVNESICPFMSEKQLTLFSESFVFQVRKLEIMKIFSHLQNDVFHVYYLLHIQSGPQDQKSVTFSHSVISLNQLLKNSKNTANIFLIFRNHVKIFLSQNSLHNSLNVVWVIGEIGLTKLWWPRSDCSLRSSLIRVFTVCHSICIFYTYCNENFRIFSILISGVPILRGFHLKNFVDSLWVQKMITLGSYS